MDTDINSYRRVFGERLKYLMEQRHMSEEKLGYKIGLTGQTIHAYRAGRASPTLRSLISIVEVFGVSMDWLFGRDGITAGNSAGSMNGGNCIDDE